MERLALADPEVARRAAEAAFKAWCEAHLPDLPPSADVQHVGATAIPGCATKGDLDIAVRVDPDEFPDALKVLEPGHRPNLKSVRDDSFAAFEAAGYAAPLGVQLVVKGSRLDIFTAFRDALLADPQLVERYNALKARHEGEDMALYRNAKSGFVRQVLAGR